MKKITSILLSFILVISSIGTVFADENGSMSNFKEIKKYTDGQFADVSSEDWFAESVKNAYELGLISGTSETTFNPNANITLAETITLASRLNNTYYGNTHTFNSSEVWYQTYVDYAIEKGIIKTAEYTDLNAFATRSQFAQIFVNALPEVALKEINEVDDYFIPDVSMDSDYAKSVYKLYRAGILTGNDDKGTFTPDTNIQRSAVAAIVSRMASKDMRINVTFKLPRVEKIDLGKFDTQIAELIEFDGKIYCLSHDNVIWFDYCFTDNELYTGGYLEGYLNMVFNKPTFTPQENNPFVEGVINFYGDNSYELIETKEYISASQSIEVYEIKYNNKSFKTMSARDYINAKLDIGDTGTWNGVRFIVQGRWMNWIEYNLNDLSNYFGLNRSFAYEPVPPEEPYRNHGTLVINE